MTHTDPTIAPSDESPGNAARRQMKRLEAEEIARARGGR